MGNSGHDQDHEEPAAVAGSTSDATGRDTVAALFAGYRDKAADYRIKIENAKIGAGIEITADRPLSRESLWSIRSVLAMEPYIDMTIEPDKAFSWRYTYRYYSLPGAK